MVFAVSYDSEAILADFAERFGISYPLLSDQASDVIREFGILNTHIPEDHKWFGVYYGVSDNAHVVWDLSGAERDLGYRPKDGIR